MHDDTDPESRPAHGGTLRLSELRTGRSAIIARIVTTEPSRMVKLSSLGVMPGARVTLVQRHPAVVLRVAETSVAVDMDVAEDILVEDPGTDSGR